MTAPLGGIIHFPPMPQCPSTSGALLTVVTMTASAHTLATVIRPPISGSVDWFAPCIGRQAGALTANVRFSFQDLSAGVPDGAIDQFRTVTNPTLVTVNGLYEPGLMTSDGTDTGVKRTLVAGVPIACVMDFAAYTAGSIGWKVWGSSTFGGPVRAYVLKNTVGTWATQLSQSAGNLGLYYTDIGYVPVEPWVYPVDNANVTDKGRTLNTGTSPDEYGNRVALAVDARVAGAWAWVDADGDYDIVLYDGADQVLASAALLATNRAVATYFLDEIPFAGQEIAASAVMRIVCKPTSGTSIKVAAFTVASASHMSGAGGGVDVYATHRTNGGGFTDIDTERAAVGLLLDAF